MKERPSIEAVLENAKAVIDVMRDNEILKSIPIFGKVVTALKGAVDIRNRLFVAKIMKFLEALEDVAPELKEKIRSRVSEDAEKARKVGETVLLLMDRIAHLDKADIIATLFIAYAYCYLTSAEFQRITQAVDQAFISDLARFLRTHNLPKKGPSKEFFMQSLYPSGLTEIVGGGTWGGLSEFSYGVSRLGNKLINAYNYGRKLRQKPAPRDAGSSGA